MYAVGTSLFITRALFSLLDESPSLFLGATFIQLLLDDLMIFFKKLRFFFFGCGRWKLILIKWGTNRILTLHTGLCVISVDSWYWASSWSEDALSVPKRIVEQVSIFLVIFILGRPVCFFFTRVAKRDFFVVVAFWFVASTLLELSLDSVSSIMSFFSICWIW